MLFSKRISLLSIFALMVAAPQVVFATDSTGDATVTSKRYVDSKLPADSTPHLLVTPETSGASATKRAITGEGTGITGLASSSSTGVKNIPTAWAVKEAITSAVSNADISTNTVNGAPLSNAASYFYGVSETAAGTAAKTVTISAITTAPTKGMMIIVNPKTTNTATSSLTLSLNGSTAAPIKYQGSANTAGLGGMIWKADIPVIFVYDGTTWHYAGYVGQEYMSSTDIDNDDSMPKIPSANLLNANYMRKNTNDLYEVAKKGRWEHLSDAVNATGYLDKDVDNQTGAVTFDIDSSRLATTDDDIGELNSESTNADKTKLTTAWAVKEIWRELSNHTVNGAQLGNGESYFYGTGVGAANSTAKTVNIYSIHENPKEGTIIVVNPETTHNLTANTIMTLNLNNLGASQIFYKGTALISKYGGEIWKAGVPVTFVYDGAHWMVAGVGYYDLDTNTNYQVMTQTEINNGTATAGRLITPKSLVDNFQKKNTAVTHTANTAVGSATKGVYVNANGTVSAMTYELNKTVPADAVFTDTTYDVFSTSANGLVPMASGTGATSMFLKGDGTWGTPTDTNTTYSADNTTIELDGTTFKAKTAAVAQNGTALTTGGQVYDYAAPKTTAVTHTANAAVGSTTKPVYIASDGTATEIGYTIQTSVPANAVFTDTTYDVFTGATSSANGTTGLVKQPLIADRTKFLKGDGTWATPTDTTYNDFTGANGTSAGAHGLVPAPTATDNTKFLKGDGTWGTPTDTNTTYSADNTTIELDGTTFKAKTAAVAQNGTALTTGGQVYDYAAPKTTAVTHTANTSVGTQYKGVYVNANGTVSAMTYELKKTVPADAVFTDTTYDVFTGATSSANGTTGLVKQPLIADRTKFLKGDGTWATPTDTTYNDFTGANGTSAGAHGLVPAPTATDNTKFLKGDGTWAADNDTTYSADNTTIELDGTTFKAKTAAVAQNGTALTTGGQVYDYAAPKTTAVTHTANTAVGTTTKGVYVDTDGTVKAMTYELKKTVPADAVFTDSVTTVKNHDGTDGASTAADGSIQVTKDGTTTYPVVRGWDSKQTAPSSAKVGQVLTYSGNTPGASATPNSSVTAKYIQAPVATGDPNATSNPGTVSGLASIWVE